MCLSRLRCLKLRVGLVDRLQKLRKVRRTFDWPYAVKGGAQQLHVLTRQQRDGYDTLIRHFANNAPLGSAGPQSNSVVVVYEKLVQPLREAVDTTTRWHETGSFYVLACDADIDGMAELRKGDPPGPRPCRGGNAGPPDGTRHRRLQGSGHLQADAVYGEGLMVCDMRFSRGLAACAAATMRLGDDLQKLLSFFHE